MTDLIDGIDVSYIGQGKSVNWKQQAAAGTKWAAFKIGQGNGFVDPAYQRNLAGCRAYGILPMPYFFLAHDYPAAQQAAHLLRLLDREHNKDVLLPALDIEPDPLSKRALFSRSGGCYGTSYPASYLVKLTDDVLTYVRDGVDGLRGLGVNLTLYSYRYWWETFMGNTRNYAQACPLWLATYWDPPAPSPLAHEPVSFGGWPYWTFWQWTTQGNVAGLHVDQDLFKGSLDDLRKFATY